MIGFTVVFTRVSPDPKPSICTGEIPAKKTVEWIAEKIPNIDSCNKSERLELQTEKVYVHQDLTFFVVFQHYGTVMSIVRLAGSVLQGQNFPA